MLDRLRRNLYDVCTGAHYEYRLHCKRRARVCMHARGGQGMLKLRPGPSSAAGSCAWDIVCCAVVECHMHNAGVTLAGWTRMDDAAQSVAAGDSMCSDPSV